MIIIPKAMHKLPNITAELLLSDENLTITIEPTNSEKLSAQKNMPTVKSDVL